MIDFSFFTTEVLALLFSGLAIIVSVWDRYGNIRDTRKSNKKAEKALRLSEGSTELAIRSMISEARFKLNNFQFEYKALKVANREFDNTGFDKILYSYIEDLLNQYDTACMLYFDNKIDRKRFKSQYERELINCVEGNAYKKYFDSDNPRFEGIMRAYAKWRKENKN
ncbi:hypothetical protein [Salinimicrobium sediminilitoris]|uniref:hypothetical protein n=1 Tax=Salinimicrobium sediminilitoris TaxID=2876715 RepID=UPI001E5B1CCF|nr:hypothetical protein [Salinimicrobium sediminilitoris]MCC8360587.1 hypothetical protein [Salinimicrobium sediminilitoris]